MAIQRIKKQSDLEKRLALLRRQVYGKNLEEQTRPVINQTLKYTGLPILLNNSASSSSDITYLRQDLLKIITFSSLAIGAQIVLFFLLKNNILKLNFF